MLKNNKASDKDNKHAEIVYKMLTSKIIHKVYTLFRTIMKNRRIPQKWNTVIFYLIYRK